jgi:hypothetical protein
MSRTLLQKHASAAIKSFIERVHSLSEGEHHIPKDELRALFISNILQAFLTNQFGVGSGVIMNELGDQSDLVDIIIYDNRILPPFIQQQSIGVYPAESVIATITVKTCLRKTDLLSAEEFAEKLHRFIYSPEKSSCGDYRYFKPLCTIFGFYGSGIKELAEKTSGVKWLSDHIQHVIAFCLIDKWAWYRSGNDLHEWCISEHDPETNEETKQFISLFCDRIRVYAEARFIRLNYRYHSWLGAYIRDKTEGTGLIGTD